MKHPRHQSGLTLIVSLVMLVVLTLLVVSAIRFGNINLRLVGNSQTQAESAAAAQVAIEQVVEAAATGTSLSAMSAASATISTGGATYTVAVAKPSCHSTKNVETASLDPTNVTDRACYGMGGGGQAQIDANGLLTTGPSACKDQMWDVAATVGDTATGASLSVLQGVALRVSAEVACP